MTYLEIYESLTRREKIAVHVMDRFVTDETGVWSPCLWNKILYRITRKILGRDPFKLTWAIGNMLQGSENEVDLRDLFDELNSRSQLFNGVDFEQ